jgi:hypothetical protein
MLDSRGHLIITGHWSDSTQNRFLVSLNEDDMSINSLILIIFCLKAKLQMHDSLCSRECNTNESVRTVLDQSEYRVVAMILHPLAAYQAQLGQLAYGQGGQDDPGNV